MFGPFFLSMQAIVALFKYHIPVSLLSLHVYGIWLHQSSKKNRVKNPFRSDCFLVLLQPQIVAIQSAFLILHCVFSSKSAVELGS